MEEGFVQSKIKDIRIIATSNLGCGYYFGISITGVIGVFAGIGALVRITGKDSTARPYAIVFLVMAALFGVIFSFGRKSTRKSKKGIRAEENASHYVNVFGTVDDSQTVINNLNDEYNRNGLRHQIDPFFYLSDHYLLSVGGRKIDIIDLSDVIWVYYETQTIAYKKSRTIIYQFIFFFKDGYKEAGFTGARNEQERDAIVQALRDHSFVVEQDKELYKMAGEKSADFEDECFRRAGNRPQ